MADLLILNGIIVTMDKNRKILKNGAVAIKEDRIIAVGKSEDLKNKYSTETTIDARHKLVLPGLINLHSHIDLTLCRGTCEDKAEASLFEIMMPIMELATREDLYWLAKLGCLELLRFGSTLITENSEDASTSARIFDEVGVRGVVSDLMNDVDIEALRTSRKFEYVPERGERGLKQNINLIEDWDGKANGRIQCIFGPQSADFCSEELLRKVRDAADKYGKGITIHLGQSLTELKRIRDLYGKSPFQHLRDIGLLGEDVIAAHCYHITDSDIRILKDTDTKVSHNPGINSKRGWAAPLLKFIEQGITVGLGTDNFYGDMVENMKLAIISSRIRDQIGTEPKPMKVLEMATIEGAKALGMEKEIGSLEAGKKADLIIVDMRKPHLMPIVDPVANLVHSGNGNDVESVIIDGQLVEQNGVIQTVDEENILVQAQKAADRIWQKFINEYGPISGEYAVI